MNENIFKIINKNNLKEFNFTNHGAYALTRLIYNNDEYFVDIDYSTNYLIESGVYTFNNSVVKELLKKIIKNNIPLFPCVCKIVEFENCSFIRLENNSLEIYCNFLLTKNNVEFNNEIKNISYKIFKLTKNMFTDIPIFNDFTDNIKNLQGCKKKFLSEFDKRKENNIKSILIDIQNNNKNPCYIKYIIWEKFRHNLLDSIK